jgi:hypothetical protein
MVATLGYLLIQSATGHWTVFAAEIVDDLKANWGARKVSAPAKLKPSHLASAMGRGGGLARRGFTVENVFDCLQLGEGHSGSDTVLDRLKSNESWCHPMESVWMVTTDRAPVEIRDQLWTAIGDAGQLLVVEVTNQSWAHAGVNDDGTE